MSASFRGADVSRREPTWNVLRMTTSMEEIGSAGWRGLVAAMAMSGVREFTRGIGLLRKPPPDEIAEEGAPGIFEAVPERYRDAAIELAHWGYGAGMGLVYGSLPRSLRSHGWFGIGYGLALWAAYEHGIARMLGIAAPEDRPLGQRVAVAADHVLYGAIVSNRSFGSGT